jgi:hypothetical protein
VEIDALAVYIEWRKNSVKQAKTAWLLKMKATRSVETQGTIAHRHSVTSHRKSFLRNTDMNLSNLARN